MNGGGRCGEAQWRVDEGGRWRDLGFICDFGYRLRLFNLECVRALATVPYEMSLEQFFFIFKEVC